MAALGVKFVGGPCNGKFSIIFDYQLGVDGSYKCGGATYYLQPGTTQPVIMSLTRPAAPSGVNATSAMQGWTQLQRVINKTLPAELHRADQYLRAALREMRQIKIR